MGQEAVNAVLQSLMFKRQQQEKEAAAEETKRSNIADEAIKDQQLKESQNRLKEEQRQFDLTHAATQALNNLEINKRQQDLVGGITRGEPVPGDTELSRRSVPTGEQDENGNDINDEFITHELPINDRFGKPIQVELPSPATFARQQAKQNLAIKLPEIAATHAARLDEINAGKSADLEKAKTQKQIDLEKAQQHEDAENKRNDATNRTRLAIAQMGLGADLKDPQPYIDGLINGDMTANDIKQATKPAQARTILNGAATNGFRPVTKQQQDFLAQLKGNADIIPKMDQFIGALPDTSSKFGSVAGGLSTFFDPSIGNLESEIQGRAMPLARSIGMDKGNIPLKLLDKTTAGYIPSKYIPKAENIKRRNDFANDLDKMIDSHLADLSPQQRLLLKKKYGLDNLTTPYGQQATSNPFQEFNIPVRK